MKHKKFAYKSTTVLIVGSLLIGSIAPVFVGDSTADALMAKPSKKNVPPMSTEDDGYNPDSDPMPEWLLLPDGVDENSLSFSGHQNRNLIIKQGGSDRWEITAKNNGSSIRYTNFESNKRQFEIRTNKNYEKFTVYTPGKKNKLKKNKSIDADDYFDDSRALSLVEDPGFSLFSKVSAGFDGIGNGPSKKRVKSKLTKRQINKLNHKVGFKGKDAMIANKVSWYESGGGYTKTVACENNTGSGFNPTPEHMHKFGGKKAVKQCFDRGAVGAGRGLYQISTQFGHNKKCRDKCAFSPEKNAKYAYKLRKKYGWTQWCAYGGPPCGTPAGSGPAMQ